MLTSLIWLSIPICICSSIKLSDNCNLLIILIILCDYSAQNKHLVVLSEKRLCILLFNLYSIYKILIFMMFVFEYSIYERCENSGFLEGFTLLQMLIGYNCYQDVNKCVVLQMLQM